MFRFAQHDILESIFYFFGRKDSHLLFKSDILVAESFKRRDLFDEKVWEETFFSVPLRRIFRPTKAFSPPWSDLSG